MEYKSRGVRGIICSKSTAEVRLFAKGCACHGDAPEHHRSELIKLSDACKSTADRNPPRRQPMERDTDRWMLTGDHPGWFRASRAPAKIKEREEQPNVNEAQEHQCGNSLYGERLMQQLELYLGRPRHAPF